MEERIRQLEERIKWYEKRYGPYIEKRGVHNWKNLFRKPTLQEWIILAMLMMSLFIAWAYNRDISMCREWIDEYATDFGDEQVFVEQPDQNLSLDFNLTFKDALIIDE